MSQRFTLCSVAIIALMTASGVSAQTVIIPNWSGLEEIAGAFGTSVGGVSDLDADGRGDFIVGAPAETVDDLTQGGRVYVHSGRIGLRLLTIPSPRNESFGNFGWSVSGVPDTDADGRGDFIVGAPNENPGLPTDCGRAYLYSGTGDLRFILAGPTAQAMGRFGYSVAGVPDLNGDSRGEMIVGAPGETEAPSPAGAGRAHVFSGGGNRLYSLQAPVEHVNLNFGWSVSSVPDVNSDGVADLVVGAPMAFGGPPIPKSGRVFIYNGATGALLRILQSPAREDNGRFGHSVAGIADVNGDGRGDIVVGAPFENPGVSPSNCGRAYLFSAATGQLIRQMAPLQPVQNGNFGISVAGTLDLNNDFRGDIIVGAPGENAPGILKAGRVHVFSGATGARLANRVSPTPEAGGAFGASVSGAPDANNNTRSDVLAGAPAENPGASPTGAGRAYLLKF